MPCLSPATLKAFLADALSETERSEAEGHLSQCAPCRHLLVRQHHQKMEAAASSNHAATAVPAELLETARAIGRRQGRSRQPRWVGPLAAAALVVLAVGVGGWQLDLWDPNGQRTRLDGAPGSEDTWRSHAPGDTLTGAALVTARGPADGAVVDGAGVTLSWSVTGQVQRTTLTLVDGLGNIVWQDAVDGSSWALDPGRLQSMPSGTLYWFVTVRLDDGATAETELRALHRP